MGAHSIMTLLMLHEEEEHLARERKLKALCLLQLRANCRERSYLTSQALVHSAASPWFMLDENGTDLNFMNAVGLTKDAFNELAAEFENHYAVLSGPGRSGRPTRFVNKRMVLSLLLHKYVSRSELKSLCELFGSPPATTSRTLAKAEEALERTLENMQDAAIRWPTATEQMEWAALVQAREPIIAKKFGFIDGKNYKVQEPTDSDLQNALYNGWLHSVLITGTLAFGADGCIFWMKHNCPGSWNNGKTSRGFRAKLLDPRMTLEDHGVLADSAFPVSGEMKGRIVTPLKLGDLERAVAAGGRAARIGTVNNAVVSIRQAAEWGMGAVEKCFRCLTVPLPYDAEVRRRRLLNIHRLYNYRVRRTNVSQIRNVFSTRPV
jgi:hypothetical protein